MLAKRILITKTIKVRSRTMYRNLGYAIEIPLNDNKTYNIIANILYVREKNNYMVSLFLRDNRNSLIDQMDIETPDFHDSEQQNIKIDVMKYVYQMESDGNFDYYFERSELYRTALDKGIELLEGGNVD